jgi:hypothetical protein
MNPTRTKTLFDSIPQHPHLTRPVTATLGEGKHALAPAPLPTLSGTTFNEKTTMGKIASDPMIRTELKQTAAATLIQKAVRARQESKKLAPMSSTTPNTKVDLAPVTKYISEELPKFNQSMQSREDHASSTRALSTGNKWGSGNTIAKSPVNSTMVRTQSAKMHQAYDKGLSPHEQTFLSNLEAMAPDVRGSFYFNQEHENKILGGGFLMSHAQREQRHGPGESKTTDKNVTELGNNDNVFFFLEHKDDPFKRTRFVEPSEVSGKAKAPRRDDVSTGDERRIRVPLEQLMQPGTWAMGKDFLGIDRTDKNYKGLSPIPVEHNFIDGGSVGTQQDQAKFLMRGLGLTAIQRMRTMTDTGARTKMFQATGAELMGVVNRQVMSPQLQVPGGVSLHTPGMEIERAQSGVAFSDRKKF